MATNDDTGSDVIAGAAADTGDGTDVTPEGTISSEIQLEESGPTVNTLTILPQEHAGTDPEIAQVFQQQSLSCVPQGTNARKTINVIETLNLHMGRAAGEEFPRLPGGLPPSHEDFDEKNGIKKITEYKFNDEGKIVKVVKTYNVETRKVSKSIARRKTWKKFGSAERDPSGPNPANTIISEEILMQFVQNKENQAQEEEDPFNKLKTQKIVQCRICKGDHWTTRCPYKDTLAPLLEKLAEDAKPAGGAPAPQAAAAGAGSTVAMTTGKHVPPVFRDGAAKGRGESMATQRKDYLKDRIKTAEKVFVETEGYRQVCDALDYHGHVLISGSPGSGKTTMSLYIMGKYIRKSYNVIFLEDLSNFDPKEHIEQHVPTLLVFDDIFGYFSLTTKELVHCRRVFNYLKIPFDRLWEKRKSKQEKGKGKKEEEHSRWNKFKVIMNSRTNVLEAISSKLLEYKKSLLRPSTIADLTVLTKLCNEEKKRILQKHLEKGCRALIDEDINTIVHLEYKSLGFPHLCELFIDSMCPTESAIDFFKRPMTYLVQLVKEIFATNESKGRAGVLLLMLLNDGVLRLTDLQSKDLIKESGLEEKLERCKEIVEGLPSPLDLSLTAKHENHTLLVSEGDTMKFSHPTIHDAVAFVVGLKNPLFVLENCSLQFILERAKIADIKKVACSPSGGDFHSFIINLSLDAAVFLIKRLAKEIMSLNFALSLSHSCFSSENLVRLLFQELATFDNMATCLHSPDDQYGLGFLFWSSFISIGPMCEILFENTSFNLHEILEGCFGCCMSGNIVTLRLLISHSSSTNEITASTLGNILERPTETRSSFHCLSTVGSPTKQDVPTEKETPRMHGDNRDMLIHIAAANGFLDVVQALIELGTKVDVSGGNHMTALMHACYLGNIALVKLLLTKEADLLLLTADGDNCLHLACRGGSIETVKLLHEIKMDFNTRGEHDRTPLMYASYNGHEELVKFLLQKGAEPEPDLTFVSNKDNCLHLTCIRGHTNVAVILLEQGHMNIEMKGQNMRTPLMYAIRHGQLETAQKLVSMGANIEVVDNLNFSCLHVVAKSGHVPTAEWLLDIIKKDALDCLTTNGRTPLMFALQFGQTDMVNFLLKKGANIKLKGKDNTSCLSFATKSGIMSLVDLCLDAGQDINSADVTGLTPAVGACRFGHIELLKYLVNKGADIITSAGCLNSAVYGGHFEMVKYLTSQFACLDINKLGYRKRTPLMSACSNGFTEIAKYLKKCGAEVGCKDEFQRTCLHMACRDGCLDMVEWLLSLNLLNIDDLDSNGKTPLMNAVRSESTDVIEILVRNGADVHGIDKDGRTCLHSAAWHGKVKSCQTLLGLGINVDVTDRNNRTSLMLALQVGQTDIVNLLLEKGANIKLKDKDNTSCLISAAKSGSRSLVDLCLDAGQDVNSTTVTDFTPVTAACRYGHIELLKYLVEKGADVTNVCLHSAVYSGHFEMVKYLTSQFACIDINKPGYRESTPFMSACNNGFIETAKYLKDCGAEVSCENEFQQTCLHMACRGGCVDMVEWLLSLDLLNIDDPDFNGITPLMYAVRSTNTDVIEILVRNGAQIHRTDKDGRTSLHSAAWHGKAKSCETLLALGMNVDVPDRNNRTPLMSAFNSKIYGSDVVKVLLKHGADINWTTKYGDTCLHCCHPVNVDIILDLDLDINVRGAYSQTPIMLACKYGKKALFDVLLQRGANVTLRNNFGASCLHLACMNTSDNTSIINELLDIGLDPNMRDDHNKTPGMYAVSRMNLTALQLLLSRGASLDTYDQRGMRSSLLHFACCIENMCNEIPQLLIDKGIGVNVQDGFYMTPAMCAARHGNRNLVEFLELSVSC